MADKPKAPFGAPQYGPPAPPMSGVDMTYGDPEDGGGVINLKNPYMMDPSALDPYAAQYLQNNNDLYSMYSSSAAGGAFNPDFYKGMHDTQEAHLTTGISNAYARAGLGGSSAAMGGIGDAISNNDMAWLNRQQSDQRMALQGLSGLNQQGYAMTTGIQTEYGAFQDQYNQNMLSFMGLKGEDDAHSSSLWGDIASGIGKIGLAAASLFGGGGDDDKPDDLGDPYSQPSGGVATEGNATASTNYKSMEYGDYEGSGLATRYSS